jgi:hypothetical protein
MQNCTAAPDGASTLFESQQSPLCEHCNRPFARREGNGGSPQRFCSSECRTAFHSGSRSVRQRSPACDAATEAAATPIAEPTKATQEAAEAKLAAIQAKYEEERFDWFTDDSVIVERQLPIAIYINKRNHIVIRQEADWGEDEDSVVIVAPANIREFIIKLCDVAGIPSVGAP